MMVFPDTCCLEMSEGKQPKKKNNHTDDPTPQEADHQVTGAFGVAEGKLLSNRPIQLRAFHPAATPEKSGT
jgi:hypothetical protein